MSPSKGFRFEGSRIWVSAFTFCVLVLGFEVFDLDLKLEVLLLSVPGLGFWVWGFVFHVSCFVFLVSCFLFRVWFLGFRL